MAWYGIGLHILTNDHEITFFKFLQFTAVHGHHYGIYMPLRKTNEQIFIFKAIR